MYVLLLTSLSPLRPPPPSGGVCHPWLFIEEVAHKEVERDYNSVYSRLVLCKTYRLDEDGKVLSPEEVRTCTAERVTSHINPDTHTVQSGCAGSLDEPAQVPSRTEWLCQNMRRI